MELVFKCIHASYMRIGIRGRRQRMYRPVISRGKCRDTDGDYEEVTNGLASEASI